MPISMVAALVMAITVPTPQSLLDELRRQTRAFENASVRASWTNLSKGQPKRWEDQQIFIDDLGRFHMTTRNGAYDADGKRTREAGMADETNRIFDGEKSVTKQFFENKDRVGKPVDPGSENAGYRTAQVHDAQFSKDWITSYRSPLRTTCGQVVFGLTESIEAGREVTIVPSSKEKGLYELTLKRTKGSEIRGSDHLRALLDPAKGWLPVRVDEVDTNNRLIRRAVCEYTRTDNGFWVPKRGSKFYYGRRSVAEGPLRGSKFEVHEIVLNDPNFDDSVFQTTLKPDTAVSDIRYGVSFRVGEEDVFDSDLNRLAKQAVEERQQQEVGDLDDSRLGVWRFWFLAANLLAIVVLVAIVIVRKLNLSKAA